MSDTPLFYTYKIKNKTQNILHPRLQISFNLTVNSFIGIISKEAEGSVNGIMHKILISLPQIPSQTASEIRAASQTQHTTLTSILFMLSKIHTNQRAYTLTEEAKSLFDKQHNVTQYFITNLNGNHPYLK